MSCQPTFFLIDLLLDVQVDAQDEYIGDDVEGSYAHEDLWIVERYLFRYLHHPEDDDHIGAVKANLLMNRFTIALSEE
jgi:hypothetical protein